MTLLRFVLAAMIAMVGIYTAFTIADHGMNLVPIFFGDIGTLTWPGQFNMDFSCFLILSATWIGWRHHFSPGGIAAMPLFLFGGIMVLAPYLLYLSFRTKGDVAAMLLGETRAAAQ